jgi:hypothetical protein
MIIDRNQFAVPVTVCGSRAGWSLSLPVGPRCWNLNPSHRDRRSPRRGDGHASERVRSRVTRAPASRDPPGHGASGSLAGPPGPAISRDRDLHPMMSDLKPAAAAPPSDCRRPVSAPPSSACHCKAEPQAGRLRRRKRRKRRRRWQSCVRVGPPACPAAAAAAAVVAAAVAALALVAAAAVAVAAELRQSGPDV